MATSSPFSFSAGSPMLPAPPPWLQDEAKRRLVSLLNHVLMQEPAAMDRLRAHAGKSVLASTAAFAMVFGQSVQLGLTVTPAGLFDLAAEEAKHALTLDVAAQTPMEIAQAFLSGKKPDVRVEGDVQLAADLQWLVDNLRWDVEEDLARLIGDVPARAMGDAVRTLMAAVRKFAAAA
jgi:ubiquinone biosynthesis accessory factor UbiJ